MSQLKPNVHGDWLNKRNERFNDLIPLKSDSNRNFFAGITSSGVATSRDAWCYNYSKTNLEDNIKRAILFFNAQSDFFAKENKKNANIRLEDFVDFNPKKFSWDRQQKKDVQTSKHYSFNPDSIFLSLYRPFSKQWIYFNRQLNNCVYQLPHLFPSTETDNILIIVTGVGAGKNFSTLITNILPNYHTLDTDQCFPLYWYEKKEYAQGSLFEKAEDEYIRHDGISDFILEQAQSHYGHRVEKEDIFYYVYSLLHSSEYRQTFANDLKKMLPRLPLVEKPADFWMFSKAGRELADLHLNYEDQKKPAEVKVDGGGGGGGGNFIIKKNRLTTKWQK
jgi:predicted helicase